MGGGIYRFSGSRVLLKFESNGLLNQFEAKLGNVNRVCCDIKSLSFESCWIGVWLVLVISVRGRSSSMCKSPT